MRKPHAAPSVMLVPPTGDMALIAVVMVAGVEVGGVMGVFVGQSEFGPCAPEKLGALVMVTKVELLAVWYLHTLSCWAR